MPAAATVLGEGEDVHADLARPLDLGRVFDLVVCVEVAEHLEARDEEGEMVGYPGLLERVASLKASRGADLIAALFSGTAAAEDDRTAVLVTRS